MDHYRPASREAAGRHFIVHAEQVAVAREALTPGEETPTHRHPVEQCVFVVDGSLQIELGRDTFAIGAEHLVLIPAGTPHRIRNVGDQVSHHLDVYLPTPDPGTPADEACVAGSDPAPAGAVRPVTEEGFTFPKPGDPGLGVHWLARRESGSRACINVIESQPGSGSPPMHIHEFVQIYYQLAGELTARVAGVEYVLRPGDLMAIPPGVPHEQENTSGAPERHFTVNSQEPVYDMSLWDAPVEFRPVSVPLFPTA